ncbi:GIY-YIG nuclease family protein [Niallia sp. 01092]|uniref:GIY-YIG nuclease family protein n=1 Tax=unclassified Niallia TaxID=2837522 RepID=UPI003FD4D14A
MEISNHYFYVLQCGDGTFYAGYTNDLDKRVNTHNKGKGAKYTRGRLPVTLVYFEVFSNKSEAQKAEYRFKQLDRKKKEQYVKKEAGEAFVAAKKLS